MAINITTDEFNNLEKISDEKMAALIEQLKTLEVEFDKIAQGSLGNPGKEVASKLKELATKRGFKPRSLTINNKKPGESQLQALSNLVTQEMVKQAEVRKLLSELKQYLGDKFDSEASENMGFDDLSQQVEAQRQRREYFLGTLQSKRVEVSEDMSNPELSELASEARIKGIRESAEKSIQGVKEAQTVARPATVRSHLGLTELSEAKEREDLLNELEGYGHQRGELLGLSNEDLQKEVREKTLAEIMTLDVKGVEPKAFKRLNANELKQVLQQFKMLVIQEKERADVKGASKVVEEGKGSASKAGEGSKTSPANDGNTPKAAGA